MVFINSIESVSRDKTSSKADVGDVRAEDSVDVRACTESRASDGVDAETRRLISWNVWDLMRDIVACCLMSVV